VTYAKDVAPILQANCVACHRPGEVAPMSLRTYKEVRPWARSIRDKVASRVMPPWFADPHYGQFANDCRLTDDQIRTIEAWVDGGSVEGDTRDLPEPRKFLDGWNIGKPDVVFTMPAKYSVPAKGVIEYKFFAVPTNFTEDHYVQLAEIRPGNRSIVHHIIVDSVVPSKPGEFPAGEIPVSQLGALFRGGERRNGDGRLVGWAPGEAPLTLKPGQAKLLKAGSVLIFQVHYTTNGTAGEDQSSVGLIYARTPVQRRVVTAGAVARNLVIPAGDPNYEATASFEFKEDSHIESLHPHMHFRGKDFIFRLVYPDGTSKVLLSVPHWDFGWQLTYFLKEPVAAPKGSHLDCVAHYDNSANNKFNPDPTKRVTWGEQTWDEMMIGYLDYTIDGQDLRTQNDTAAK
ncbi:MAG: hypothetical protein ACREDR_39095, partial [Blastocatellia bacterium]